MLGPERQETYRAAMPVTSPQHGRATLIVLRVGLGPNARTWVTFEGSLRCTAMLTDQQIDELTGHLHASQGKRS